MHHVPNLLSLLRLALVPVMGWFVVASRYDIALPIFLAAALTDLADGYIARRFGVTSRLGAMLDPIADKLNMLVATVLLAGAALLPLWLAVAIVLRDVIIVAGALAYRAARGHLQIAPTWLSKLNTVFEFAVLLLVMAIGAGWVRSGPWLIAVFLLVLGTVIGSGVQYVWLWGRKALAEGRHP